MAKPEEVLDSMVRNLKEKTGKSIEDWIKIVKGCNLSKHGEIVNLLKEKHGIGHGHANMIVHMAKVGDAPADGETLVNAQYAGGKAGLRAIYESLLTHIKKWGSDVEVAPKKAYVSLRRSKQFALIQPSTATRLDVGINLKGTPPTARLEASGSFNAMVSHRVRLEKAADVDQELLGWLKKAYDAA